MAKMITGAVALASGIYRAGQEGDLEAAANAEGVDLSHARFAGSLSGYDAPVPKADAKAEPKATTPKAKK